MHMVALFEYTSGSISKYYPGANGICITDHESNGLTEYAQKVSRDLEYPIFVGAEILTYEGDALVFGIDELPEKQMHSHELSDYVHCRGGVIIMPILTEKIIGGWKI